MILGLNKIDLGQSSLEALPASLEQMPRVETAAAKHQGINSLEAEILKLLHRGNLVAADVDIAINQRQAAALTRAQSALNQVRRTIAEGLPLDFWTIDLRSAIQALGEITGEELTESMLGQIFSKFCIGK